MWALDKNLIWLIYVKTFSLERHMKSKRANMVPFATLDGTIKTETTEMIF